LDDCIEDLPMLAKNDPERFEATVTQVFEGVCACLRYNAERWRDDEGARLESTFALAEDYLRRIQRQLAAKEIQRFGHVRCTLDAAPEILRQGALQAIAGSVDRHLSQLVNRGLFTPRRMAS